MKGEKHMLFFDASMLSIFALSPLRLLARLKKTTKVFSLIVLSKLQDQRVVFCIETQMYKALKGF